MVAIRYLARRHVGDYPLKNNGSHIDASLSRQPLVKGERLVRAEMNAVIITTAATARYSATRLVSWLALPEGSVGSIASVARACAIPLRLQRSRAAAEARALLSRNWRAPTVQGSAASPPPPRCRSVAISASLCAAARPMIKCSVAPRQVFRRGRRLPADCAAQWPCEPKRARGMGSTCRARVHASFSSAALVGSRSQADHLTRNSAMDDSIGGS